MYFLKVLERNVQLPPKHFGHKLEDEVINKLRQEVEGTSTLKQGAIISVTQIESIGKAKVHETGLFATFPVSFRAIVYKPFRNEVVDAVVTSVYPTGLGFEADAGPISIFITSTCLPSDHIYDGASSAFVTEDGTTRICAGCTVRIKITGVHIQNNGLVAVGTMAEDFLGLLSDETEEEPAMYK